MFVPVPLPVVDILKASVVGIEGLTFERCLWRLVCERGVVSQMPLGLGPNQLFIQHPVAVHAGLVIFCFFGGLSNDEDNGSFVGVTSGTLCDSSAEVCSLMASTERCLSFTIASSRARRVIRRRVRWQSLSLLNVGGSYIIFVRQRRWSWIL